MMDTKNIYIYIYIVEFVEFIIIVKKKFMKYFLWNGHQVFFFSQFCDVATLLAIVHIRN